jgi:hypothetical protein
MPHRRRSYRIFSVVALALLGAAAPASAQTLVITAKSLNDLADDFEYLIKTVAPEGDPKAQQVLDAINQFRKEELAKGLDQGRPFGVTVSLPKDFPQGGPPSIVAAVPVKDLGQFLDSLKGMGVDVSDKPDAPGFSHKVTAPNGNMSVFVLESKGYGIFSLTPDDPDKLKAVDPASWRPKGRPESTVSYRVKLSEIPDALKEQMLAGVDAQAQQQNERKEGEKEADYKARVAGQDFVISGFKSMIKDGDILELDLDVSKETQSAALELALSGRPGTEMAKNLRSFGEKRSRFEGLGADAAVAGWLRVPLAKEIRDLINTAMDEAVKEGPKDLKTDEQMKLFSRFVELMRSSLKADELDMGMSLQPSGGADSKMVFLSAMSVRDGDEFERLFRDAAKEFKDEKHEVTLDADKAADDTAIHRLSAPADSKNEDVVKTFGKPALYVAFRKDAVWAAFGEEGLAVLKQAMGGGASAPSRGESDGPVAAVAHTARVGAFPGKNQETMRKAAKTVFPGPGPNRDRIYLGLKGEGDGLRLRLSLDVPALKFFSLVGQESKK